MKLKITPHYQEGTEVKIAFVFSCPGQCEEKECRPVAKTTGRNLETLMKILNEKMQTADFTLEKITITNSWSRVEYPAKTGRTEAKQKEILIEKNLERLSLELIPINKMVICSGNNAAFAVKTLIEKKLLYKKIKIIYLPHLGTRGINMKIKDDINGNPIKPGVENATYKRLEKIASEIMAVIK
jgi:hypothetical protein